MQSENSGYFYENKKLYESDPVAGALSDILKKNGRTAFGDGESLYRSLCSCLPDPKYRKDRNRIRDAYDYGAAQAVIEHDKNDPSFEGFLDDQAAVFADEAEISEKRAREVLARLAFVISEYEETGSAEETTKNTPHDDDYFDVDIFVEALGPIVKKKKPSVRDIYAPARPAEIAKEDEGSLYSAKEAGNQSPDEDYTFIQISDGTLNEEDAYTLEKDGEADIESYWEEPDESEANGESYREEPAESEADGESYAEEPEDSEANGESYWEEPDESEANGESYAEEPEDSEANGESYAEEPDESEANGESYWEEPAESEANGESYAEEPDEREANGESYAEEAEDTEAESTEEEEEAQTAAAEPEKSVPSVEVKIHEKPRMPEEPELKHEPPPKDPDGRVNGKKQYKAGVYEGELFEGVPWGMGVFSFNSGERYEGHFTRGKFNGTGTLYYKNGDIYEGDFKDNNRHGTGTTLFANGRKYIGDYREGKRSGHGVFYYENGSIYEGGFLNGKPEGEGVIAFEDESSYSGEFKNGIPNGKGIYCDITGISYEGTFSGEELEGEVSVALPEVGELSGKLRNKTFFPESCKYPNGGIFTGEFNDGVPNGKGRIEYADGSVYEGYVIIDKRSGKGKLTYKNGNTYEGSFVDDIREGEGVFTFADGKKYTGMFKGGHYNGRGTFLYKSGNIYEGPFVSGLREGKGVMTYVNGDRFVGEYKKDKISGSGTYYFANGDIYEGEWEANQMNGKGVLHIAQPEDIKWDNGEYDYDERLVGEWRNGAKNGHFLHYTPGLVLDEEYADGKRAACPVIWKKSSDNYKIAPSKMLCRYGGQNAFIIETASATFLFDWYMRELPYIRNDKPLNIFISSISRECFNSGILDLVNIYDDVSIYLGYDRSDEKMNSMLDTLPEKVKDAVNLFEGEQTLACEFGTVRSFSATADGVAFMLKTDGMTFLHGGGLLWQDNSGRKIILENNATISVTDYIREKNIREDKFKSSIASLKGLRIDYAMLPLDPRFSDFGEKTVLEYLQTARISVFTPMSLWGNYGYASEFARRNPNICKKMISVNPERVKILRSLELMKPFSVDYENKIIK